LSLLRAPLVFDAPQTRLVFDAKALTLWTRNPELARHNDAMRFSICPQLEREH